MNEEQKKVNDFAEKYSLCVRELFDVLEVLTPVTDELSRFDTSEEIQHITELSEEALRKLRLTADNLAEASERLERLLPLYEVLIPPQPPVQFD